MSASKLLSGTQGCGIRFEPCAPFNSGVDIDDDASMEWNLEQSQLRLSHGSMYSTVSGPNFQILHDLKHNITAHTFGDGFVLCVPAFKDLHVTPCRCNYANYGFVGRGSIDMHLMTKNMAKPLAWELDIINLLTSHSQSKMQGKLVGERWGIFKERKTDILSLEYFNSIVRALKDSPLADSSIPVHLLHVLGQLLSCNWQLQIPHGIDFDLNTLVKAILISKLLFPDALNEENLLMSIISISKLAPDARIFIYEAATSCKSGIIDAVPRRDTCKLATLPNSFMGLGEINATEKQKIMLGIVATPYKELCSCIGRNTLEQRYHDLKRVMISYFDRIKSGYRTELSGEAILEKASVLDWEDFCSWWASQIDSILNTTTIGTVQVQMSEPWSAADVIDCFALGVLAGSARLAEYLPIEVNIATVMGLEAKLLNPVLAPCAWYNRQEQGEKYRVDSHHAGLSEITGEALVRTSIPDKLYHDLQHRIGLRTKNVTEDYVLAKWDRPKPIIFVLTLAAVVLTMQLIFDRAPDDNPFTIATRAVTNFVGISIVVITLIIKIFYNDWSLHDMWNGQRKVTDVRKMSQAMKSKFADVVIALRNSGAWDRAMSDTNAGLILRDQVKKGGVVMGRGLRLEELKDRKYLFACSWKTVVIPRKDGRLEIFQRTETGGVYLFSSLAEGAVITCVGKPESMENTVG